MCMYVNTPGGKLPMLPIAARGMLKQAGMMPSGSASGVGASQQATAYTGSGIVRR